MHKRRSGNSGSSNNGYHPSSISNSSTNNNMMYGGRGGTGRGGGRSSSYNRVSTEDVESGTMNAKETNAMIMEQQNNERIAELHDSVARLKGLTMDIHREVKEQNKFLDDLENNFGTVGTMLAGSLKKIGTMLEKGGAKHMCYMVAFVVFVMVFLYWLMTYKGQSGA